jgi:arylformamidase
VWPGDEPVDWTWTTRIEDGSSVNVGAVRLSTHAGTHVDAPYHVWEEGARTDAFDVSTFVGPAEVIAVEGKGPIRPHHVSEITASRVLFRTTASALPAEVWPETIVPLDPETVSALEERDVVLVGTDAPSVDPLDSADLPAHHALIRAGIANLEGLTLADVDPGLYSLFALPMKMEDADAAPVRAVLGDASFLRGAN